MLGIVLLSLVLVIVFGIIDIGQYNKAVKSSLFDPSVFKLFDIFKETIVAAFLLILTFIPAILLIGFSQVIEQQEFNLFYQSYIDGELDDFDYDNFEDDENEEED